ncbi:hypothetical protein L7F22_042521 [Adiantum nelumboides]|nr:hypothetical protein [Adiantum nelumboides]
MDVTEEDWLSVFTVLQAKGQKVKLQTIRPKLYNKFMMLYQMVYQELPINSECAALFAKAFAFENCQRADLSLDKSKYRVAWAIVAEDSITQLGAQKQGLSNKMSRVMTHMTEGTTMCKSILVAQSSKVSVNTSNSHDVELAHIMRSDVQAKALGISETLDDVPEAAIGDIEDKHHAKSPVNKDCGDTLENMLAEAKRKRQGSAKPPSKRMKKTLFNKTPPRARSGSEIPCLDIEIGRHAKDASKDPALSWVIDLIVDADEGPSLDTIADASLNTHRVSINGTMFAPDTVADASLNSEVSTNCVNVDGSVDGNVPDPQQAHQASPMVDHPNTTSQDHGACLLCPNASLYIFLFQGHNMNAIPSCFCKYFVVFPRN